MASKAVVEIVHFFMLLISDIKESLSTVAGNIPATAFKSSDH